MEYCDTVSFWVTRSFWVGCVPLNCAETPVWCNKTKSTQKQSGHSDWQVAVIIHLLYTLNKNFYKTISNKMMYKQDLLMKMIWNFYMSAAYRHTNMNTFCTWQSLCHIMISVSFDWYTKTTFSRILLWTYLDW